MAQKIEVESLPHVQGWMSLPQAGEALKLSRQQIHRMAFAGKFKSLSRIGTFMVVEFSEVFELAKERFDNGDLTL